MVPPNMNKLPVVGQTPYKAEGADPQDTPTPLRSDAKQTPLQIYETERAFFGSAPVGGLDILCSELFIIWHAARFIGSCKHPCTQLFHSISTSLICSRNCHLRRMCALHLEH